jgi:1,4-dihydroxy-2-naphthoate octaprenyltransferase
MDQLQRLTALIRLGRPHFLAGGFILHGLGAAMAVYDGATLHVAALVWGQVAITATQFMTHYANDYYDLAADRANRTPTFWSGGSRVLVNGLLRPSTALRMALLLGGIALIANLVLSTAVAPGIGTFALPGLALVLAWSYSAPPLALHSRGLGEATTAIIVTLLTPLTGYYLQMGHIAWLPILAVVPLCAMQFAMLLAIEFPDADGDREAGKRTLVVRMGADKAARLYVAVLLLAYAILPFLGLPLAVTVAIFALSPLAVWQIGCMRRGDWRHRTRWGWLAFRTIALLMGTAVAELVVFVGLIANGQ